MEKTRGKNTGRIIIAAVALCVLAAALFAAHLTLRPRGTEGAKTISIEITADGETVKKEIGTNAAYLRQALEEQGLIQGDESEFGLWVTTVDGRTADGGAQEWWALYKNGEFSMTGIDDTPVEDGDIIGYILTVGYDDTGW